jgi:WxcM-like, C-terminal
MSHSTIYDCNIIQLPRISERSGNITAIESYKNLPFELQRIFYLYDIPGGEDRGAHAHKACHQFIVAASGAFDVMIDDGVNKKTIRLDRPYYGLHVLPEIWAAEQSFSSGAICLVLASRIYEESDYIRDYNIFKEYVKI